MVAGTDLDRDAALGEGAPTHLVIEGAEQGMAAGPEEMEVAGIGLGLVFEPGLNVGLPQAPLFLGLDREVDDVLDTHPGLVVTAQEAPETLVRPGRAPLDEIARAVRAVVELVAEPEAEVPKRPGEEGRGPAQLSVAGVVGPAIDQQQKNHRVTLNAQLPRHLVSNIAAETIAAKAVGSARLKPEQISDILRGQRLDGRQFRQAIQAA